MVMRIVAMWVMAGMIVMRMISMLWTMVKWWSPPVRSLPMRLPERWSWTFQIVSFMMSMTMAGNLASNLMHHLVRRDPYFVIDDLHDTPESITFFNLRIEIF